MSNLNQRIADRLSMLRREQSLSLDQLAVSSGISRATLSRLEKGDVSATAENLGKLCNCYGISLSRLMMMVEDAFPAVVEESAQFIWKDPQTGYIRRSISPPAEQLKGEVLECVLPPGATINYDASPIEGLEHHLIMIEGGLSITLEDQEFNLAVGDCLRYLLKGSSRFCADAKLGAKYMLVLIS